MLAVGGGGGVGGGFCCCCCYCVALFLVSSSDNVLYISCHISQSDIFVSVRVCLFFVFFSFLLSLTILHWVHCETKRHKESINRLVVLVVYRQVGGLTEKQTENNR